MILEFPNYISTEDTQFIKESCRPFIDKNRAATYNRDGHTVSITEIPELELVDKKIHSIMNDIQVNLIQNRYKPQYKSADSGYEYHMYNANDICHHHSDGEVAEGFLRYASVIIQLTTNDGELIFPSQNKTIKTEEGKVVIFPPYGMYGHYVTPSSKPREVLVSWFIYDGITIR
jgi:hypothetical protein